MSIEVSIIIPVYNAEKYLDECFTSLLQQNFVDCEIIVVDDSSTDKSLHIAEMFARKHPFVKLFKQAHAGSGAARNLGLQYASGKYVIFLDADDFFAPTLVKNLYEKAQTVNADLVFCGFDLYDDNRRQKLKISWDINRHKLPNKPVFGAEDCLEDLFDLSHGMVWNHMYRRDFLQENKLHFSNTMSINDIYFTCTALLKAERIAFVDEKLIWYRINQGAGITYAREEFYMDAFTQIWKIHDFMLKNSLLEKYKHAYLNFVLGVMFKGMSMREPMKSALEQIYFERVILPLKMIEYEPDYYTIDERARNWLFSLKNKKFYPQLCDFAAGKNPEIVPIVLASNDKYAPYAGVAIQSIIENASANCFYDIYVLYDDISAYHVGKLEKMFRDNVRVSCLYVTNNMINPRKLYAQSYYSKEMFFRILIPDLFYGYEKVLYLDCDLVTKIDVKKLWQHDVSAYALGGCMCNVNEAFKTYLRERLRVEPEKYINSGVLLFNLAYWQKYNLGEKVWNLVSPKNAFIAPDQDILNIVCKGKIFYLPPEYNATVSKTDPQNSNKKDVARQNITLEKAKILHFVSNEKPWNSVCRYAENWWHYAALSPFYEEIVN